MVKGLHVRRRGDMGPAENTRRDFANVPVRVPTWMDHGSGGVKIIRFQIIAVEASGKALCSALGTPPGSASIAALPEVTTDGELYVHDPAGCHFSEPGAELLGRQGYAVYLQSADCTTCDDYYDDGENISHWEVMFLCCRTDFCPEVS